MRGKKVEASTRECSLALAPQSNWEERVCLASRVQALLRLNLDNPWVQIERGKVAIAGCQSKESAGQTKFAESSFVSFGNSKRPSRHFPSRLPSLVFLPFSVGIGIVRERVPLRLRFGACLASQAAQSLSPRINRASSLLLLVRSLAHI